MAKELAFAIINPYTIAKSRTGGILARYIGRTQLDLVAARMFQPSRELADAYAKLILEAEHASPELRQLLSDYVRRSYGPDPITGRPRRAMFLLFEGEDAYQKIWDVTGGMAPNEITGQTIRDTFGDYVLDESKKVQYFEPAVMVAREAGAGAAALKLWARHATSDGGICAGATDVAQGGSVQRTLVLLKPDNFRFRSLRPGNIVDLLSRSGLRIVAVKKFNMTVAQAEQFYGPVLDVLESKFEKIGGKRVAESFLREFEFEVPADVLKEICQKLGRTFALSQFERIVQFMTGFKPSEVALAERPNSGREECFALVYQGPDAVRTIRQILGPTDPSQAEPGSVRREFGSDIMVNAAHASDSPENAQREMNIIDVAEDTIGRWVTQYYGA
ncbi:MAG: nucleoside-diphosphate kinase [Candidatus Hydrogenedentes bacterium]|nr:nucleoside-diphosphate kinase [Candidatus Hydrogenedentota bacterium]